MRSWANRTLSATLMFALAALPAGASPVASPIGIVTAAAQARVGSTSAISGSTVLQGDRLATAETGQLLVRFGGTQARLMPGSLAEVDQTSAGVNATLLSGSVKLASAAGDSFSLTANHAVVRPDASQAVIAQVTRVNPGELLISSSKGALDVMFDGEVTTIQAGNTYRMLLDPAAAEPQGTAGATAAGRKSRKRAVFILMGAAGAATGIAIGIASSSSAPVSPSTP
jgi:hypothetical protein